MSIKLDFSVSEIWARVLPQPFKGRDTTRPPLWNRSPEAEEAIVDRGKESTLLRRRTHEAFHAQDKKVARV